MLNNSETTIRYATYIDETGEFGLGLTEKVGKWVGVKVENFPELDEHFLKHGASTGVAWEGQQFKTKQDYLGVAVSIITNPNSRKVLYYNPDLNNPRLGYLLERNGEVFLVPVGDDGTIRSFFHLNGGWSRVTESSSFQKLFIIDYF